MLRRSSTEFSNKKFCEAEGCGGGGKVCQFVAMNIQSPAVLRKSGTNPMLSLWSGCIACGIPAQGAWMGCGSTHQSIRCPGFCESCAMQSSVEIPCTPSNMKSFQQLGTLFTPSEESLKKHSNGTSESTSEKEKKQLHDNSFVQTFPQAVAPQLLTGTPPDFVQQPEKMLQLWMDSSHVLDQLAQCSVNHHLTTESIVTMLCVS